ncbi:hypothetical protein TRICI_005368 [Trichomonascus ciferrii]|uniref:BCD1 alpha/beta domain-containing protein n=1 Tax=Trichomonascus ciferrii TaxID=44093 RepID=A0A642UTD1_9ASCO|nr:hypothetical protein TRICI_005368 [Trichomonascus ciferrii]
MYSCRGLPDPTKYVGKGEFSEHTINRDYNFLQRLGRGVQVTKNDVGDKGLKRTRKRHVPEMVKKNGVNIKVLPLGMRRAIWNKSGYNSKRKRFIWTLEWIQYSLESDKWQKREQIKSGFDGTPIEELVTRTFGEQSQPYEVYLKKIGCPANRQKIIKLDKTKPLNEELLDRTVIEFPTLYLIQSHSELPPDLYDDNDGSSSSSDSDSDSESESDSSSESEDDDDDNSNSDDEPPEETSSHRS